VLIYLQPFLRYSKFLVENCDIFIPHLCLAAPQGVTPLEFRDDLDTHKTRMNGLSCGEESMTICSAVSIQYQRVTDGQPIAKTCFSLADARKNGQKSEMSIGIPVAEISLSCRKSWSLIHCYVCKCFTSISSHAPDTRTWMN